MYNTQSLFCILPLLISCSEYNLHSKVSTNSGNDSQELNTYSDPLLSQLQSCENMFQEGFDIGLDESCEVPAEIGNFEPVVKWHKGVWSTNPESKNIMMTPIVVPLNDDNGDGVIDREDTPDILVLTFYDDYSTGILRAISGDDGRELWSTSGDHQLTGALAAGDIDNDGLVEIIVPGNNGKVFSYSNTGEKIWEIGGLQNHIYGTSDAPAIADLNADGNPEVIVGRAIISGTGTLIGYGAYGMGRTQWNAGSNPSVADVDLSGVQNIIVGNAIYNHDGTTLCHNEHWDGYTAIGNFNEDLLAEVVVSSGGGQVRLQDAYCNILWETQIPGVYQNKYGGSPTIADYDGDGLPEIGIAAGSSYTVLDDDGSILWQRSTQDGSSGNTGSSVFDFEGDGVAEAIYPDEQRLWVFNGPDGEVKLEFQQHSSNTWTEYAVVVDVDADDHAEIVMGHNNINGSYTGVTVIEDAHDSWQAGRRIWNQHAYSITNVDENGGIPPAPEPNWLAYNNFRSGDLVAASGSIEADLYGHITQVCTDECEEDTLYVLVSVGNQGAIDVNVPVVVDLWGVREEGTKELLTQYTIEDSIPSGFQLSGENLEITRSDLHEFQRLQVVVDSTGMVAECNESNNYSEYEEALCIQ